MANLNVETSIPTKIEIPASEMIINKYNDTIKKQAEAKRQKKAARLKEALDEGIGTARQKSLRSS